MKLKDLDKIESKDNSDELLNLLSCRDIIARVVELEGEISGWVVYRVSKNKIRISKIAFGSNEIAEFIINNLKSKNKKFIEISISEYDLKMQLILKNLGFLFKDSKKINNIDYYKFMFN
jgi:hypothetical protein